MKRFYLVYVIQKGTYQKSGQWLLTEGKQNSVIQKLICFAYVPQINGKFPAQ
jgi:hypothetical protein